ncbi:Sigma 54 interacting domain protein [Dehalogenimonas lykanthroporepellens BL-DC-9]|nr:Sigma 54 interacting domain protein [Dehalogenimonas lykanthroporepellens BL-DC-9]
MLLRLHVKNFGIIEDFDWTPGSGLNVLTGETGAGKSLVVDALSALLSGRLDDSSIRHGTDETRVEGTFELSSDTELLSLLTAKGIDTADGILIISLSLKQGGRTVTRLNGDSVPRSLISEIGRRLVDIHSQSQHLSLLDRASHLDFLDSYAGVVELRQEFASFVQTLQRTRKQLEQLTRESEEDARQADFLQFQVNEILQAGLTADEDSRLEQEKKILVSAETIRELAQAAVQALDGDEATEGLSASAMLSRANAALDRLSAIDPEMSATAENLRLALDTTAEAVRDLRSYAGAVDANPARLEEIQNRLSLIGDLKRKYGATIEDVLEFARRTRIRLDELDGRDEKIAAFSAELAQLRQVLAAKALALSEHRRKKAVELAAAVNRELAELAMAGVRFEINLDYRTSPEGLELPDGPRVAVDTTGIDRIEFLAATNPGEPAKPLEKIASTGELSRFTLAVKTALARADRVPVLIFDEIDIGVGGRSGDIIGLKLATLAESHQVICVTHLPQIAVYAGHHFTVAKNDSNGRTVSRLTELSEDDRVTELAMMLSGTDSRVSRDGATELLARSAAFRARGKDKPV